MTQRLALMTIMIMLSSLYADQPISGNGPFPADIAAWTAEDKAAQVKAGEELLKKLETAVNNREALFIIPKGDYRFTSDEREYPAFTRKLGRPAHIFLEKLRDITIDGSGSTFWFEKQITAFALTSCSNVTIRNLNIDWDPLPFTQGEVVAVQPEANTFDVRIDPAYLTVTEAFRQTRGNVRGVFFDSETRRFKQGQWGFNVFPFWDNQIGENTYRLKMRGFYGKTVTDSNVQAGDLIALWVRRGRTFRIEGCSGIQMIDINVYASGFVAVSDAAGKGGTLYRRFNIIRRPGTNRLISNNADGINCANLERGPIIEDCRMEWMGDDFVNVHGHFGRLLTTPAPNQIVTSRIGYRGSVPAGTIFTFYDRKSLKPLGQAKVVESAPTTITPTKETCLADLDSRWHSGDAAGLRYGEEARATLHTLDQELELTGDIILSSESFVGAGSIVRNCHFIGSLARGIRMQSPYCDIAHNILESMGGNGISMSSHPSFWGEGVNVHHGRIHDNTIIQSSYLQGTHPAIMVISPGDLNVCERQRCIEISENRIIDSAGAGIEVRGAEAIIMRGNTIDQHNQRSHAESNTGKSAPNGAGHAIILENVTGEILDSNTIRNPGPAAVGEVIILPASETASLK